MIKRFRVRVEGKEYEVEVEDMGVGEKDKRMESVFDNAGEEKANIKGKDPQGKSENIFVREKCVFSPMPANVVKVNCKVGDMVKRGDKLIIIEAMKMENDILSHVDGVVKEIRVTEGMSVSQNDILVVFE